LAAWLRSALGNYSGLLSGRCGNGGKIKPKPPEKIKIF
jgi:hypothetical protein